ncbi:helix-turn-helix domain-containing protein [Pseudodesulfovibrio indicus]|uniref:helix-turn-helix domain-containing protein n=1 Tax=Pseudodesulfovibrio indicus TaxID=1716143 RepID=UPI0029300A14|nr:helix-turn-helix domain-containing protein [Pseudodesulfovibrio indicus]
MSALPVGKRFNPYRSFSRISVIPNVLLAYPGLSPSAKLVWARLAQYAGKDGRAYPSVATLAADLGLKKRQIQNLLAELRREGFIESSRGSGTNSYYFLLHPCLVDGLKQEIAGPEANKCRLGMQGVAPKETKKENQRKKTTKKKAGRCLSFSDLSKKQQKYIELKTSYELEKGNIHTSPSAFRGGLVAKAIKGELDISGLDRLEAWARGEVQDLDSAVLERIMDYQRHDKRSPEELCGLIRAKREEGADTFWGLPIQEVFLGMRVLFSEYW